MKKLLSLTLSLLILLSLTACKGEEEPPATGDTGNREWSPYADANTDTDRYYLSVYGIFNGILYQDDFYYRTHSGSIVSVPLSESSKNDVAVVDDMIRTESVNLLCSDPLCSHKLVDCPTMMRSPDAEFLIDATESNGEQPIIYYFRATSETWDGSSTTVYGSEIIRFDVAEGKATQVAFSANPIIKIMTYRDRVYFVTKTSDDKHELNTVKKTGGEVTTVMPSNSYLHMIGANKDGVYVNDEKGNVYALDYELKSQELIYTTEEVYPLQDFRPFDLGMFVEDEYLYFFADFKGRVYEEYMENAAFIDHSIRRVKLSDPEGEGEMVAESVYQNAVFGVYNGVLYYGPFNFILFPEGSIDPYSVSQGDLKGVDLETLETFDVLNDCGLDFIDGDYYINDRCIIGVMFPYRERKGFAYRSAGSHIMLYGFKDGALFPVQAAVNVLPK